MIEQMEKHNLIAYRAAPAVSIAYTPSSAWNAFTEIQTLLSYIDSGICGGFKEVEEEAPIPHHISKQVDEIRADIRRLKEALDSICDTLSVTFDDGEELDPDPWSIDWETWKDLFERMESDWEDEGEGGA